LGVAGGEAVEVVERRVGEVGAASVEPKARGVRVDREAQLGREDAAGVFGEVGQDQRGRAEGAHRLERRGLAEFGGRAAAEACPVGGLLARRGGIGGDGGRAVLRRADLGPGGGGEREREEEDPAQGAGRSRGCRHGADVA
jgi:hypothetical protein